jgi:hypothetical protein
MSLLEKSRSILSGLRGISARRPVRRVAMLAEELEPRILHSADVGPALLHDGFAAPQVETRVLDAGGEFAATAAQSQQARTELVIVDTRTPDYQKLVDDIRIEAAGGRQIEVHYLDNQRDGIDQITAMLSGRNDIGALHFISHGSEGAVQLGGGVLDLQSLREHAGEIETWANALAPDADLLIYGCNVAGTPDGRNLVDALSRLTGADVAASDNLTGNAALGGDWNLEYATGRIDTALAIDAQTRQAWAGVLANSSPVLSGANNLAPIAEDPATNPGTQVSALLAGHVTDANSGDPTGIAVTAVDNTSGNWQYSINAGGTWNNLGSPSDTSARLLRSTDFVRFVPNADFNGAVNNGLTFRAWDQTSGTAGGTANTLATTSTVLDTFSSSSYTSNDGTAAWSAGWVDTDGNPAAGNVQISGGQLQFTVVLGGGTIFRQADLTGATSATLSLSYDNQFLIGLGGNVALQISNNGGGSYTTLHTFSQTNTGTGTLSFDIGAYIAANTRIQFVAGGIAIPQVLGVDNVQISYVTPLASGMTAFSSATASSSIAVTAVNDAPAGTANTVITNEDTAYVFSVADFGFSDTHDTPANDVLAVKITTLPGAGSLSLNGIAVTTGQLISAGDIAAGDLAFSPSANGNGTGYASFTFQVQDDGGGADLDVTARTMTINVTTVNDPPAGSDNTVAAAEDGSHVFSTGDFGFSDPSDTPANILLAVKITTAPVAGSLTLNAIAVTTGQFISASDIVAGKLVFSPAAGANGASYASFTFQVQDNGGGADLDPTARTMTIAVTAVNDPPAGTNKTVTAIEDGTYTFSTGDFGFSDAGDTPSNNLFAVKITTLPGAGALTLSGIAVSAGQFISAADVIAGNLKFSPAASGNGAGYASFTFQVQDDGGGADLDPTARTMTIDVAAVNDPPAGTSHTVTATEDGSHVFSIADFGFTDSADIPANAFLAVNIATLPAAGSLTLNGLAVGAGQLVAASDIIGGNLIFTPAAGANGTGYASFTFQVQDDGGGSDLDPTARTMTIDVVAVNDPPAGTNNTITVTEDVAYSFVTADFGFSDPADIPANNLLAVKISALPGAGSLTLSGVAVITGQLISAADLVAGNLKFTPAANANGAGYASFTFQVQDDGGGADLDVTARTMTIDVTAVNDAPAGTSNTISTPEDGPYTFGAADFGFTDPGDTPGNNLLAVKITTLPGAGSLTLNGVGVTSAQFVSAADIVAGNLKFSPAANAYGSGYASFTFQVQDDGGGIDLDAIARTMTIDVIAVNDPPAGTSNTVSAVEDGSHVFSTADFGFSDSTDAPANAFLAVKIATLPGAGALTLNGIAVSAGQFVAASDIVAGNLLFTPASAANGAGYASFTFQVQDAGGGADLDPTARTMTIDVTAVNDPPVGTNSTVATTEDGPYTFGAADFGFTDPGDTPANNLLAVKLTTLPAAGSLTLNGVAVTAGQVISAADLIAGKLKFAPAANANGAGYASFTFQVQDDGGGIDLDVTARTMTIDVTAVNDPPAGTSNTVTAAEDGSHVFATADFGFLDAADTPANALLAVKITTVPGAGSLTLNGFAVTAGQFVSASDIAAGKLVFSPAADANGAGYASFTFQVQDGGGGADLDTIARTMTIDVTAVNDPPIGTSKTVTIVEDANYTFGTADFGFSDPGDSPASNFLAVRIGTLPGAGSLTLAGVAVIAGQFVSRVDIAAGDLQFTPSADANGAGYASFTFQVQDDGGGADLDATLRTMTIDVTAVNDAPTLVANTGLTLNEGASAVVSASSLHVTDVDSAAVQLVFTVTTTPSNGYIELTSAAGVAVTSFTQDDIDNNRVVYVHDDSQTTSDGFSFTVADGAGGGIGSTAFAITIAAIDDAPVNSVPAAQTTDQGAALMFSSANGNAISISDADAGAGSVGLSLSASNGTMTLATTAGLTFAMGTGTGDATMQFSGTVAAINAALDGLRFTPDAGFAGAAAVSIVTDDLGNSGSGGPLTTTSVVNVSVASTATPPVATPLIPVPVIDPLPVPVPVPPVVVGTPGTPAPSMPGPNAGPDAPTFDEVPSAGGTITPDAAAETPADTVAGSAHGVSYSLASLSSRSGRAFGVAYVLPATQWLLFGDDPAAGMADATDASFGLGVPGDGRSALQSPALMDALDRLREGLQEQSRADALIVATTAAASLGLSVGYVLWLLRGGVLVSSMLSSLPAWRLVDPLPILGRLDEDDEEADDDSLESLLAANNAPVAPPDVPAEPTNTKSLAG